jgi:hypothetical protein
MSLCQGRFLKLTKLDSTNVILSPLTLLEGENHTLTLDSPS